MKMMESEFLLSQVQRAGARAIEAIKIGDFTCNLAFLDQRRP
jgi:hypothetical protein